MSVYRFAPLMALAGGAFAAPVSAAVISQSFGPWLATGETRAIAIGAGPAQYSFKYSPQVLIGDQIYPAKGQLSVLGNSTQSQPSATYGFPGPGDGIALNEARTEAGDGTQYVTLRFDIDSHRTVGIATFNDAFLTQIDYRSIVPEPAVWAQMIAGLSLAGLALRTTRRRRTTTVAA